MTVAALFIDPAGPYPSIPGVDCWDEARDARRYPGPHPVVAHPPCHLWVNFAALNYKRYGGEHNRPGNDGGCFAAALNNVLRWGGVLEHPAGSNAWEFYGLPKPSGVGWSWPEGSPGWVCEVWQSAYGHKARKRTWLFYGGLNPLEADWRPATKCSGTVCHDEVGAGSFTVCRWRAPSPQASVTETAASGVPRKTMWPS